MSIVIESKDISPELEDKILKEVFVKKIEGGNSFSFNKFSKQKPKEKIIQPLRVSEDKTKGYIPFDWSLKNINNAKRPNRSEFSSINVKFNTTLREGQKQVKEEAISALNKRGSIMLALYPGFGKTSLSIFLSSKIGLKTLIICHRIILLNQWEEAIKRFIDDAKVCLVKPGMSNKKIKEAEESQFLLVNAQNVKTLGEDFFKNIGVGLVIVDEIHLILCESLSECLGYLCPRYLIGLSATPYRADGLDKLLDFYFGEENKIIRELYHPHIVYKIDTRIKFEEDSKDWNALITEQSSHEKRNKFIVDIILHFKDRHFLVLCKRIEQSKTIFNYLQEEKENVSLIAEDNNKFDKDSRIIVATTGKAGVGFSVDSIDSLILASDIQSYFEQYMCRCIRREDVSPIIFDLVDDDKALKRHFTERKKVYEKAGGVIHSFNKQFPELMKELK